VLDVLAVLAAGLIGYALGGWLGVAVGACSATAVSVLLEPLTPPGDRLTAHERRMRKNRRYRVRYEALEDSWRNPYRTRQRTDWKSVDRRLAQGVKLPEPPAPEIVPVSVADEGPAFEIETPTGQALMPMPAAAFPAEASKPAAARKRSQPKRTAEATRTTAAKPAKATKPPKTAAAAKPAATRKPRKPRVAQAGS
jgi:xanthine/CO dehydrogenase XdhC/CoxF family maturation factor